MNDELWVERRLSALSAPENWHPNTPAAYAAFERRERRRMVWRRRWAWSSAGVVSLLLAVLALPPAATCAIAGVGCPRPPAPVLLRPGIPEPSKASRDTPVTAKKYKESGSPTAPLVCEIYSDYQCPFCATFFNTIVPLLISNYVTTGKVRIVYRDLPLPRHAFAKQAARYANAAGELGHYEEAVTALYTHQAVWSANGDVDGIVAAGMPAGMVAKIRLLVQNPASLDAAIEEDLTAATDEGISGTPTLVLISNGVHRKVAGVRSFELLRQYINELLANRRPE